MPTVGLDDMRVNSDASALGSTTVSLLRSQTYSKSSLARAYLRPTLFPPAKPRLAPVLIRTSCGSTERSPPISAAWRSYSTQAIGFVKGLCRYRLNGLSGGTQTSRAPSAQ